MFNTNPNSAYVSIMLDNRIVISLRRDPSIGDVLDTFCYVQARDGLWVPKCDRKQYESGQRKIAGYGLESIKTIIR